MNDLRYADGPIFLLIFILSFLEKSKNKFYYFQLPPGFMTAFPVPNIAPSSSVPTVGQPLSSPVPPNSASQS